MALTLNEAAKLSNDVLLQGVIETIIDHSPVLQSLPFIEVLGNGLTYNREKTLPTVAFRAVGDDWDEDTPEFEQVTAPLRIIGGDADVDQFLARTRRNVNDLEAEVIASKAKATQRFFDQAFISGDSSADPKAFDGLDALLTAPRTIDVGVDGGPLTMGLLDELIDMFKAGPPDMLMMSRRTRRELNTIHRATGSGVLSTERDEFGRFVTLYNDIPIRINDFIADDRTHGQAANATRVYGVRFGADDLAGLTGDGGLQVEHVGPLETKDAHRHRIKWYATIALFREDAIACLDGVVPPGP